MQLFKSHLLSLASTSIGTALAAASLLGSQQSQMPAPGGPDRPAISTLDPRISALEAKLESVSRSGNTLVVQGVNLHVRNGTGSTAAVNGRGNVIIGEHAVSPGSHNVLVGEMNQANGYAAIVAGHSNFSSGSYAHVLGGQGNRAGGLRSVIVGGADNETTQSQTLIGGGHGNQAWRDHAVVLGGALNTSLGSFGVVRGGRSNFAVEEASSVTGGRDNRAYAVRSVVSGGREHQSWQTAGVIGGGRDHNSPPLASNPPASTLVAGGRRGSVYGTRSVVVGGLLSVNHSNDTVIAGGQVNEAEADVGRGVMVGGMFNRLSGAVDSPTITGGWSCTASGEDATVSGGHQRSAEGDSDWRAGSLLEDD